MSDVNYSQEQIDGMIAQLDASPDLSDGIDPRTWREVYDCQLVTDYDVIYAWSFLPELDDDWTLDPESYVAAKQEAEDLALYRRETSCYPLDR